MTAPQSTTTARGQLLRGMPGFAAATVGLVGVSAWVMTLVFHGPGDYAAIGLSALVSLAVQIGAFPAIRGLAARNVMLGWGAGSLVRFLSLIVYAVLGATVLHLPLAASLISLFVFYFLSMVIEPLFLRS